MQKQIDAYSMVKTFRTVKGETQKQTFVPVVKKKMKCFIDSPQACVGMLLG